ncbi:MAG: hypothetical protein V3R93_02450 [Candidatus Hydrothermarchaeaceae archaeon]
MAASRSVSLASTPLIEQIIAGTEPQAERTKLRIKTEHEENLPEVLWSKDFLYD